MRFTPELSGWLWAIPPAVAAGILALYFLKLRRQPLVVPSTWLWRKSIEDLHANAFWQRLRRNLLLLLQLLFVLLAFLALLGPATEAARSSRRFILLLDRSASMRTIESLQDRAITRLELAKRAAANLVRAFQPGDSAMIVAFADDAVVLSSFVENQARLLHAIDAIQPTDRPTDLTQALTVITGLLAQERSADGEDTPRLPPASVLVFSDGRFAPIADTLPTNLPIEYRRIGEAEFNVAIVAFSQHPAPDGGIELLGRIENRSAETTGQGDVELLLNGQRVEQRPITLAPGERLSVGFTVSSQRAAAELRLRMGDKLAADDRAFVVLGKHEKARVLVLTDQNPVLLAALRTSKARDRIDIEVQPTRFLTEPRATERLAAADLVVFDRCGPSTLPAANTWFLGSVPPSLAGAPAEVVRSPILINWSGLHPAMRFLNLDDVSILAARILSVPKDADILIESDQGPLLAAIPRGVHTDLVQMFPFLDAEGRWQTDWPLKPSFPLFVLNVLETYALAEVDDAVDFRPGEPIQVRLATGTGPAQWIDPAGTMRSVERSSAGIAEIGPVEEVGLYRLEADGESREVAVNLFDPNESTILPADRIELGGQVIRMDATEGIARNPLWKWFALLAFVLLLLEWFLYVRRLYI